MDVFKITRVNLLKLLLKECMLHVSSSLHLKYFSLNDIYLIKILSNFLKYIFVGIHIKGSVQDEIVLLCRVSHNTYLSHGADNALESDVAGKGANRERYCLMP